MVCPFRGITKEDIDNELRAIDKLCKTGHPSVVEVFEYGQLQPDSSFYCIDMELCDFTLEEYIHGKEVPQLQSLESIRSDKLFGVHGLQAYVFGIAMEILNGLIFIHRHNEVHRDLSPQNGIPKVRTLVYSFLVLFSVNSNVWKIADFGLTSTATSTRLVPTEYARGRTCYRAPELLRTTNAGYNAKADIWSLGCVMYELYTGQKIFQDDYAVIEYWTSGASLGKVVDLSIEFCALFLQPMLEICPQARPSARTLLQNIPKVRFLRHPFGETSLAEETLDWAVSNGDVAIVEAMVENGVSTSADYLTIAVHLGNTDLLKALLGNYFRQIFSPGWKALYEATARMDDEMVDILLDGGVEWRDSEIDPDGGTILHMAVAKGNTRIVQLLLNAGLEIHNLADGGRLQYLTAAGNEDAEMLQLLKESGCESKKLVREKFPLFGGTHGIRDFTPQRVFVQRAP